MPVKQQPDLTIVIPAYCEEKRIGATLDTLALFLDNDPFFKAKGVEVLVVAADAPDKTHGIIEDKKELFRDFRLLKPGPRAGKGRDVRYGMLQASGKAAIYMDADLATPLRHLQQFYEACMAGTDIVIGTRDLRTYRPSRARNLFASLGNQLYRMFGGDIEDTQCGFKMFNEQSRAVCFSKLTILGWGFDLEVLAIVRLNGLRLQSYRIDDWQHMPHSTYTDGMLTTTVRTIRDYGRIRVLGLRGAYFDR